jgi:pimeloyl-ACP methyl ester carboxylesterase
MTVVPHVPPLWRESRVALEAARLFRSAVWRRDGVPAGNGRPVLLVPGFMAGDGSLGTLTRWLRANGYWTSRAGIRANVGCSQDACERLERRAEALTDRTGEKVAIIGQSRGGVLARVVAYRRPDLISGIVTLGAPTVSMLKVHPLVLLNVGLVGALGTGRVPGLMSLSCLRGACCATFRADLPAEFPMGVGYVSAYSRSDGIVDWHACLDPAAENVEVHASHCGMAVSEQVYRLLAGALAEFGGERPLPLAA